MFFFFKQKTAYEMRISDWSSDVCSSDLLGEDVTAPAQDAEFVLYHADNVEASGFVQHLKLPHHVDFQSELTLVRLMRAEVEAAATASPREPAFEEIGRAHV